MAEAGTWNHQYRLNHMNPAADKARLGDVIYDLVNTHNDLVAKFNALLAHLDTGNVTGIGAANAATYAPAVTTVKLPENR